MKRFSETEEKKSRRDKTQIVEVPLPPSHAGIVDALRRAFQQQPEDSLEFDAGDGSDLQEEFRRILGRLN